MKYKSVAIDGPSGAGKSTIAKAAAKALSFVYVDTGAIYRTVGLFVLRKGIGSKDATGVTACLVDINIEIKYINGTQRMFLNDEDVSDKIRTPEVSIYASDVSAIPSVREFLLQMQRKAAEENNVIMDGRDIGTVVLPNADVKIFLTADAKERAKRRTAELLEKGMKVEYDDVLKDILYRDQNDSNRAIAPLRPAEDSLFYDTTELSLEENVNNVIKLIKDKIK